MNPEQMMKYAKKQNIDLTKAYDEKKLYFIDLSSVESTRDTLGNIDLSDFASKYRDTLKKTCAKR